VDDKGSRHILSTLSVEISKGLIVNGEPSDSRQGCSLAYARSRMRGDPSLCLKRGCAREDSVIQNAN
jgi:hypothetical protein